MPDEVKFKMNSVSTVELEILVAVLMKKKFNSCNNLTLHNAAAIRGFLCIPNSR